MLRGFHHIVIFALVLGGLSACASKDYDYRNIDPTYQVRNAPIPVPWPRMKPKPGTGSSVTQVANSSPVSQNNQAMGSGRSVAVQRGDTLYSISKSSNVDMRALIALNDLSAPYRLRVGQSLRLPVTAKHKVQRGETSYSISRRYGVDLTSLARLNNMTPPYRLHVGQELNIPGLGGATTAGTRSTTGSIGRIGAPPPREGTAFLWPVDGETISSFGPKTGGIQNDGINIRARAGTDVRAAEAGVVAYSGSGIRGFGNLLLVRHDGGWVTAYAHNADLLVSRGDQVRRGQPIARVGNTGAVSTPQLHFEVRKGTRAVNPVRHLARR